MKNFVIKFLPRAQKSLLSSFCLVSAIGIGALCQIASAVPAEVFITQLDHEYDGEFKFPIISSDPPDLSVSVSIVPRIQSEVVFQTIPAVPEPSYASFGIEDLVAQGKGDRVLGEGMNLGGSNRFLESVEVAMVNFAKASDWPALASENPKGYLHPLTIIVYRVQGNSLTLLAQKTTPTLIPWRPATLDDGSEYPYSSVAFNARLDFNDPVELSGEIAVLVAYNTESGGFDPLGTPGPYNALNVALADYPPLVGLDEDEGRMIRFTDSGISSSKAFGARAPLFTVRTFPANPSFGTPLDAGGYRVSATITASGYEGTSVANLEITPLEALVALSEMRQVADGTPKSLSATTQPSDLPFDVVYARRSGPPVERGVYPVFVTVDSGNYAGSASGTMRLGYSYASWIAENVADGGVPSTLAEKSDDPDLDGRTNFMEYLSATNPGIATAGSRSLLDLTREGDQLKLGVLRNNDAIDVSYQLQVTDDLSDPSAWTNLTLPPEIPAPLSMTEVVVDYPLSPSISSEFFRLEITTP